MSDCVPVTWDSTIFFDSEGIIFSSTPQCHTNVGVMPSSFSWTLKKLGEKVFLYFESDSNWHVDFNLFTDTIKSRRFALSKPTMNTHTIQVFSWKFLPNNLGVGSIVFYGSVGDVPFQIYCGDNIKNTSANPSSQTWDILNGSDLPPDMQVDSDMFLAIELEVAKSKQQEAISALEQFFINHGTNFEKWMEQHLNTLTATMKATYNNHEIAGRYSELDGKKFLLCPGEEFNSHEDSVFINTFDEFTGEGSKLTFETRPKKTISCNESAIPKRETTLEEFENAFAEDESQFAEFKRAFARRNPFSNVCGFPGDETTDAEGESATPNDEIKLANGEVALPDHLQTTRV